MTQRARRLSIGVAIALAIVAVIVIASSQWLLVAIVRFEASRRGVELAFGDASVSGTTVTLTGVRATMANVRGAHATARTVKVHVSGLSASRVDVDAGVLTLAELDVDGLVAHRRKLGTGEMRVYVRNSELSWGAIAARGIDVDHDPAAGGRASVAEWSLGAQRIAHSTASWVTSGETTRVTVPGKLDVDLTLPQRGDGRLAARVLPQPLAAFSPSFPPAAQVSGTLAMALPDGSAPSTGDVTLRVDGYTPPAAREAAGLLGARTDVSAKIATTTGGPIALQGVKLTNGSVHLAGGGQLSRQGALRLALDGGVPCSAVAGNVAGGGVIGGLIGKALKAAISGTIAIHLDVSADAKNPAGASVVPTIRASCGL